MYEINKYRKKRQTYVVTEKGGITTGNICNSVGLWKQFESLF